jgi:hypothetical protein
VLLIFVCLCVPCLYASPPLSSLSEGAVDPKYELLSYKPKNFRRSKSFVGDTRETEKPKNSKRTKSLIVGNGKIAAVEQGGGLIPTSDTDAEMPRQLPLRARTMSGLRRGSTMRDVVTGTLGTLRKLSQVSIRQSPGGDKNSYEDRDFSSANARASASLFHKQLQEVTGRRLSTTLEEVYDDEIEVWKFCIEYPLTFI